MNTRHPKRLALLTALCFGLLSAVTRSAYLDDEPGTSSTRDIAPPVRMPHPMPPRENNPVRRLLRRVDVGRPCTYGRLTVVPLLLRDGADQPEVRALDEALNRGWIRIHEQEQARVSEVVVRNASKFAVLMMAGEILGGGRQDRIIRNDVLIGTGDDPVAVPVYCGEQDRWQGTHESFDRTPYLAGQAMRSMAARAASQEAIWIEIDHRLKQSGVPTRTRSYQSLYGDRETGRRIDAMTERFQGLQTRQTVGLVIIDLGQVVGGDLFSDPALCAQLWDKIIRSHAADIVTESSVPRDRSAASEVAARVRRFLEDLSWAGLAWEPTPGIGESFTLRGRVEGHALAWNGNLVHLAAFPSGPVDPLPPEPRPLPWR